MPIEKIDTNVCTGCKLCVDACPCDVIRFNENEGFPYIAYPEDCVFCLQCEENCPVNCIYVHPTRILNKPMAY